MLCLLTMHTAGNCLARGACQSSVTSVSHTPGLGSSVRWVNSCSLRVTGRADGGAGVWPLCAVFRDVSKVWENKVRTMRQPLKGLQGLVQITIMLLSYLRARNILDTEEHWSGDQEGWLCPQLCCICYITL